MASNLNDQLHFLLIPLMAQGHLIPIIDIARLLAQRSSIVTIVTTPLNALRFHSIIHRAINSGLPIKLLQLPFPYTAAGLPENCENVDTLPSPDLITNFITAATLLQQPLEKLIGELKPFPNCIISDKHLAWTAETCRRFQIPRVLFDGTSCFSLLCTHNLQISKIPENVCDLEPFLVPGLPDRIKLTKSQLPRSLNPNSYLGLKDSYAKIREAEVESYGMIINSFQELESDYLQLCRKAKGEKIWCIGPVSGCNKERMDKLERGNKSSIDETQCLKWLDSWSPSSVIYACFGSLNRLTPPQLAELGLGLEASNRPFIWVIRGGYKEEEFEKWLKEDGYEERVKKRGFLIKGWAPQVLILSHPSIGCFLTHCGWNSTMEGICAGLGMVTWPLFAEQFYNEKMIVQVLGIGVGVGAKFCVHMGEEEKFGVVVKREGVRDAIEEMMGEGKGKEMREKARKLCEMAKMAMEEGGSSYLNLTLFIQDITQHAIR